MRGMGIGGGGGGGVVIAMRIILKREGMPFYN